MKLNMIHGGVLNENFYIYDNRSPDEDPTIYSIGDTELPGGGGDLATMMVGDRELPLIRFNQDLFDYSEDAVYEVLRILMNKLLKLKIKKFDIDDHNAHEFVYSAINRLESEGWIIKTPDDYIIAIGNSLHKNDPFAAPTLASKYYEKRGIMPDDIPGADYYDLHALSSKLGQPSVGLRDKLGKQLSKPFSAYSWKKKRSEHKNEAGTTLSKAVIYHQRHFNGKRWPELEAAFLQRANTYSSPAGDYTRPRMSLFTYMNNLREEWPEGEKLAESLVSFIERNYGKNHKYYKRYINYGNDSFIEFMKRRPNLATRLIRPLIKHIAETCAAMVANYNSLFESDGGFNNVDRTVKLVVDRIVTNKDVDALNQMHGMLFGRMDTIIKLVTSLKDYFDFDLFETTIQNVLRNR